MPQAQAKLWNHHTSRPNPARHPARSGVIPLVPPDVLIRPADPAEADTIRALVQRAYEPWVPVIGRRPAPMDEDYERHVRAGEVFVLVRSSAPSRLAGVLVLIAHSDHLLSDHLLSDHLLIDSVAVDPDCQGLGLGVALMRFAEAEAERRGFTETRLFTHDRMTRNIILYGKLGYISTHRATVDGFERIFMKKTCGEG